MVHTIFVPGRAKWGMVYMLGQIGYGLYAGTNTYGLYAGTNGVWSLVHMLEQMGYDQYMLEQETDARNRTQQAPRQQVSYSSIINHKQEKD